MDNLNTKNTPEIKKSPALFSKNQILSSKKYSDRKDVLTVLLDDDKNYTFEEIDKILTNFMKGKVK